jgi:ankyrin
MRIYRICSVAMLCVLPSLAAAEGSSDGLTAPVERVVARDIQPGLDLQDFHLMHWAAVRDQPDVLERLLDQGHDVDDRDANGRTPLMVAAAFDSRRAATILLAHGADPMARDTANGDTPLHFAALTGYAEVAKILLEHKADIGARSRHNGAMPLHYAALYGHRKVIALLVERGAVVDTPDLNGVRPLQYARMRQRSLAIELLLSLGARPDDLFDAVNAGDVARVQALLAAGADVDAAGLSGTPLHLAVSVGQVGIAVMLIDAGADLEAGGDPAGARPLHMAAYSNQPEAAKLLIDRGADVDARDALERTALGVAAAYGYADVVATLLAHQADPNVVALESCGQPLQYAAKAGNLAIAELLLSHGAAINGTSSSGWTALHCAVDCGRLQVINLLIARGADAFMANSRGQTPIQYATFVGNRQLIAALLHKPQGK